MMTPLELLAPAKNLACGMAAIDHGADAVYIGPPAFGARAAAGNSVADIGQLGTYAHRYGARVYATVNTLLTDAELAQAADLIAQLADVGVDAVLIQDMRLLPLIASLPIAIHASTQADNRTAERLQWLRQQGVSRAVLARELTVAEVAALHRSVPDMELEVFVHGALCVSLSGLCYASEYCFNRSANRGECAQFCRMKFDLLDADGRELQHQRHLLSLKDLNLSRHIRQLVEAGAVSLKIEGRLKDVAYVKNVTAAYSQLLDEYVDAHPEAYRRASEGRCSYRFQPDLDRTFNRGYTTYFANGRQPAMASFDTPKAIGQLVGRVKEVRRQWLTVAGTAAFANGDGLCFFNGHHELQGFRVNRAEGNRLFPLAMPEGLTAGTPLFRSSDQAMERLLAKPSAERKIPVDVCLKAVSDGFLLVLGDAQVMLPLEHQLAQTPQQANILQQLKRLGDTPFECRHVELQPDPFPYFIPSSQLAALRRMAAEKAMAERQQRAASPRPRRGDEHAVATGEHAAALESQKELIWAGSKPVMQCRYCLRHELGYCVRHGGRQADWREPLFLRLADGRRFRLEFDCRRCQMNVYADPKNDMKAYNKE